MTCEEVIREHQRIERWQRREKLLRPVLRWSPIVYIASATGAAVTGWWVIYWLCVVATMAATVGDMWIQHYLERWRERFAIDYMDHMREHSIGGLTLYLATPEGRSKAPSLPN